MLLLAVAWMLLQQGAWHHALEHDLHDHESAHVVHEACCACLGLHAAGAALPAGHQALLPQQAAPVAPPRWATSAHTPALTWRAPSRDPPRNGSLQLA